MAFPVFAPGDVLNASDMNAVGLWLVKSHTVLTAVNEVTVTDAFTADYANYRIVVSGIDSSASDNYVAFTLGASTASYYSASRYFNVGGGSAEENRNNAASARLFLTSANDDTNAVFDVLLPNVATFTHFHGLSYGGNDRTTIFGGRHAVATAYTAFTLTPVSGTFTGGTIKVYGYRN